MTQEAIAHVEATDKVRRNMPDSVPVTSAYHMVDANSLYG